MASPQSLRIRSGSCRASRCWKATAAGSPDSSSSNWRPSTSISSAVCGTMPGVDAGLQAAQAHAQNFERRRLVVDRPFGVAAFEREDAALAVGFDLRRAPAEIRRAASSTATRASGRCCKAAARNRTGAPSASRKQIHWDARLRSPARGAGAAPTNPCARWRGRRARAAAARLLRASGAGPRPAPTRKTPA